jgi:hypothetical protein
MRLLSAHSGFLRIRTGRLNLYRDFITHPYDDNPENTREPFFHDWTGTETVREYGKASGVLLSFFFPVFRNPSQ